MVAKKKYSLRYWMKQKCDVWSWNAQFRSLVLEFMAHGCEHPEIEFEGNVLEFANALHQERYRGSTVYGGAFFTPLRVADEMAQVLGVRRGMRVLDPAAGIGNLLWAVARHGGEGFGYELQYDLAAVGQALEYPIASACYLESARPDDVVDAVIMNPPFGNMQGCSDIALEFLRRVHRYGVLVCAILPHGFFLKSGKAYRQIAEMFRVHYEKPLNGETFAPLTNVWTEILLLEPVGSVPEQLSLL